MLVISNQRLVEYVAQSIVALLETHVQQELSFNSLLMFHLIIIHKYGYNRLCVCGRFHPDLLVTKYLGCNGYGCRRAPVVVHGSAATVRLRLSYQLSY